MLETASKALRGADRERQAPGRSTALLTLPADPRELFWLDHFVWSARKVDPRLRPAGCRLQRRIANHPPNPALALELQQRFIAASSRHERRELQLRLWILGCETFPRTWTFLRDPEACLQKLPVLLMIATARNSLSGHLEARLEAERRHGLLSEESLRRLGIVGAATCLVGIGGPCRNKMARARPDLDAHHHTSSTPRMRPSPHPRRVAQSCSRCGSGGSPSPACASL